MTLSARGGPAQGRKLQNYLCMNFKNKKITIMGLGLYPDGSGISATRFLLEQGAKLTVTDLKTKEQLKDQIKSLGQSAKKINFVLGKHLLKDFRNCDMVVKNPAVPMSSKYLQVAIKRNIPIETDISLFFQLIDRKRIIGITGTRGKSTTVSLLYKIFKICDKRTVLGGNITKSPLCQMKEVKKGGTVILELSSWMLESLKDKKLSPFISLVTNIYPDHLNTYKNIDEYAKAKENIFLWQNAQDKSVFNLDNKFTRLMGKRARGERFWFSLKNFNEENGCFQSNGCVWFRRQGKKEKVLRLKDIRLLGEHNLANVIASVCVSKIYNIGNTIIRQAVRDFSGISDRLELLGEKRGIKYYNDTTSTTPEAGIVALKALSDSKKNKEIILIAGGSDKGLDMSDWIKEVNRACKAVVLLPGTGTDKLINELGIGNFELYLAKTMADAVAVSGSFAKRGDIILLSPAFASFGLFKNEFDRGEQFKYCVSEI